MGPDETMKSMAGYSGTPLAKKLGIKAGQRVALINAPMGFEKTLAPLPNDVRLFRGGRGKDFNVVLVFSRNRADLAGRFRPLSKRLDPDGGRWACWPKKASGVPTDLSDGVVREIGLNAGLVDVKVCAIDETWSGLRFVYRKEDRPRLR